MICGKNKQEYWNYEKFVEQVQDLLHCYETLLPNHQVVLEVDLSSGHAKCRESGFRVDGMSLNYDGKQHKMRERHYSLRRVLGLG